MKSFIAILAICLLTACSCIGQSLPDSAQVPVTVGQIRNAVEGLLHYRVCQQEVKALLYRSDQCDSTQGAALRSIIDLKSQVANRQNLIRDLDSTAKARATIIRNDGWILKATIRKKNRQIFGWLGGGVCAGIVIGLIPKFISLAK